MRGGKQPSIRKGKAGISVIKLSLPQPRRDLRARRGYWHNSTVADDAALPGRNGRIEDRGPPIMDVPLIDPLTERINQYGAKEMSVGVYLCSVVDRPGSENTTSVTLSQADLQPPLIAVVGTRRQRMASIFIG
ncbi:MAG: hypothetical protein AAF597_20940, partial [Bacteroidota bacterium]